MGSVITFSANPATKTDRETPTGQDDPYYHFIENVLTTANAYGFAMPRSLDAAVERVYRKTRHTSRLASLMHNAR